jgi:porin
MTATPKGLLVLRSAAPAIICLYLFCVPRAAADENFAGFRHVAATQPTAEQWGPVPTQKASLANAAPVLLPFFNNGPVFGLPGTEGGDVWHRTQLTGDWGAARTELAAQGIFLDLYSTSTYQDVTSGGLRTGSSFVQNFQLSINVDTGRANLWPGGLFHFTLASRYGDSPEDTFTVGSSAPQYVGLTSPEPEFSSDTYPTEYFLVQALSPQFSVLLGKLTILTIADQTLFGNSYKYYFANLNFNKNPIALNLYNAQTIAAAGIWTPTQWMTLAGGVFDANTKASNFAIDAFDSLNLYGAAIFTYRLGNLPGQFEPQVNWTNASKIDFGRPFGSLAPAQTPQAVGALLGSPSTRGLPINRAADFWATIENFSQYLFVTDDQATIAQKFKSGQPLHGLGVFGRFGYSPPETSPITYDASIALFAHGLVPGRKYDSFGAGYYYNAVSGDLKDDISRFTGRRPHDERGIEVFYDFAVTPAVRVILSYQHVWDPLIAGVSAKENDADAFMARFTMAF